MRTANWAEAAEYINRMYGQGARSVNGIAGLNTLVMNQPGCIEFKVKGGSFRGDTFEHLVRNVIAAHGHSSDDFIGTFRRTYTWVLTPERTVVVGRRVGRGPTAGIYIQLKDTGN